MERKVNAGYGAVFGTYWMIYGAISSFASVFMLAKDYTNSQIGITLAVANVLAVILQPLIADVVDRSKRLDVIGITEILTLILMVVTVGMFTFKGGTLALCVVFILAIGFHTVLQPLFNAMVFYLERGGIAVNFGIARSVGSLCYSIFVAVLGSLVKYFGEGVIPVSTELVCLFLLLSLVFTGRNFHRAAKARAANMDSCQEGDDLCSDSKSSDDSDTITLMMFIKRNKMFCLINVGVLGVFFSNAILNNYMAQIVDSVGGNTEDMGRILAVMAFLEIPTMFFFKQLKNRFSCQLLLKVASVGFLVKILICWLSTSVLMLYVGQIFQLVGFALFLPGMVYFTDEMMSHGEAVKGQALYTTMITVTTIFASLLGGRILDVAGAKSLMLVSTIATALGAALIILTIDRVKSSKLM